jgi:hypothetical protein
MTRAIGQTASLEGGELSVGVGPYTADTWMGQVSGRLLQRYPRLQCGSGSASHPTTAHLPCETYVTADVGGHRQGPGLAPIR